MKKKIEECEKCPSCHIGTLKFEANSEHDGCSCHISAPCYSCIDQNLVCRYYWEEGFDLPENEAWIDKTVFAEVYGGLVAMGGDEPIVKVILEILDAAANKTRFNQEKGKVKCGIICG